MIKLIENEKLELSDIPVNDNITAANRFAHTFNGYEKSLEDMTKIGKMVLLQIEKNETDDFKLNDLRKSLFYYFRRERFTGLEPKIYIVNKYLNLIRNTVKTNRSSKI